MADIPGIAGEDIEPGDTLGVGSDGRLYVAHRPHAIDPELQKRVASIMERSFMNGLPIAQPYKPSLSCGYFVRSPWRKLLDFLRGRR